MHGQKRIKSRTSTVESRGVAAMAISVEADVIMTDSGMSHCMHVRERACDPVITHFLLWLQAGKLRAIRTEERMYAAAHSLLL